MELNLPGVHNVQNALAAIAVGREVGVADAAIAKALAEFRGVGPPLPALRRRRRGRQAAAYTLIDDYGHHPAEMAATHRRRARQLSRAGGSCSRSSRTGTRARATCSRISCKVLSTADALVLTEVYPAGEPPIVAADGRALARAVRVAGKVEPVFVESVADLPAAIRALVRDGDVVVTMGAGSIGQAPGKLAA